MNKETIKIFTLRWVGNFLVLSAVAGVALTFSPAIQSELVYRKDQATGVKYIVEGDYRSPTNLLAPSEPTPLEMTPLSKDFGILIPKIGANAVVLPGVDPGDEKNYLEALKSGVAHAKGTVYPGEIGNSFLFAHSVGNFWEVNRWNAVFYLLKELVPGDEVEIFYKGGRFTYVVYDKKIVGPEETNYLSTISNKPMLTLQTCWPPGTTLKRLLVFAKLK